MKAAYQKAEWTREDHWRDFGMRETGTGQQMVRLHDRSIIMTIMMKNQLLLLITLSKYEHKKRIIHLHSKGLELYGLSRASTLIRLLFFRSPNFTSSLTSVLRHSVLQDATILRSPVGCPLSFSISSTTGLPGFVYPTGTFHGSTKFQISPFTLICWTDCTPFQCCDLEYY
jgi:hypothetical protein